MKKIKLDLEDCHLEVDRYKDSKSIISYTRRCGGVRHSITLAFFPKSPVAERKHGIYLSASHVETERSIQKPPPWSIPEAGSPCKARIPLGPVQERPADIGQSPFV